MEMTIKSANLAYLTLEDKFDFSLTTESGDTIECLLNDKDVFVLTEIFEKVYKNLHNSLQNLANTRRS